MSTSIPDQSDSTAHFPPSDEALVRKCLRCGLSYAPAKSTSSLRLTYCSFLCELGHLGFSIAGLEQMERTRPAEEAAEEDQEGQ